MPVVILLIDMSTVLLVNDIAIRLPIQLRLFSLVDLQIIDKFEKEYPRDLLGVYHRPTDTVVSAEDVGDSVDFGFYGCLFCLFL